MPLSNCVCLMVSVYMYIQIMNTNKYAFHLEDSRLNMAMWDHGSEKLLLYGRLNRTCPLVKDNSRAILSRINCIVDLFVPCVRS